MTCVITTILLQPLLTHAADSVCAQVKIEIRQELTLERQAFDAHMVINNGLTNIGLEHVDIDVWFKDQDGNAVLASSDPNSTQALFFIRTDTMLGLTDIDGSGVVQPSSDADIHWLIIPAYGASNGLEQGTLYYVGATLRYTLGGEEHVTEVTPDYIFVKPMPKLTLDYFLPRDVYGDDAFTAEIEPPIPFNLGVRIRNNGTGTAKAVKIDSAQPRIVDNQQGLLVNFVITGSEVNGNPATPSLLADFGDIGAQSAGTARWIMECSLSGRFVDFTASVAHSDELGGVLTSLIEAANTHVLVGDVRVDLPGRDAIRDFLARDGTVFKVYESNNVDTQVLNQSASASLVAEDNGGKVQYRITAPVTAGFLYVQLPDPEAGKNAIKSVTRSDGKVILSDNAWISKTRDANQAWQHFINLFDVNSPGAYTVVYETVGETPKPPVLAFIPDRTGMERRQLSFIVDASDPNGTTPTLSAAPLPAGARFTDQGDGTAVFDWTPAVGQAGRYEITYQASDGALTASQKARITIYSDGDTDKDGIKDLDEVRLGTDPFKVDSDGDGFSDGEELAAGTDPLDPSSRPGSGPVAVTLKAGFNLMTIPADVRTVQDLRNWLPTIGNGAQIEKIMAYDQTAGRFVTLVPDNPSNPAFVLKGGEGLIVYARQTRQVVFQNQRCVLLDLKAGTNLVGFNCPALGYSAFDVLNALGAGAVSSIQRYSTTKGAFETAGFDSNGRLVGKDFPIRSGEGYFIYMRREVNAFAP